VVPQFFYLIHERIFKEVASVQSAGLALKTLMSLNRGLRYRLQRPASSSQTAWHVRTECAT